MPADLPAVIQPWMIQFAFWASLVLTILKLLELIQRATLQPHLDLRLTREVFFRLIDAGEALFCHAVLLARNGAVLVCETNATLKKLDRPEKTFPLKVVAFGEKVKGTGPLSDFYFHSTSPLAHVPEALPQRPVYLCVQEQYHDRTQAAVTRFQKNVLDLKERLETELAANQVRSTEDNVEMLRGINPIVDNSLTEIMDIVQLEPGRYQLTLQVGYQNPSSRFWRRKKDVKSMITFIVDPQVREVLRSRLRNTLTTGASNTLLGQTQTIIYPEYQPLEILEIDATPAESKR
jgi:hypothetical protein